MVDHHRRLISLDATDWKGLGMGGRFEDKIVLMTGGARGIGRAVVNIASAAGLIAGKRASPYVSSKHGVLGLTKAAVVEYPHKGIRVNAVCPGITETAQTAPIVNDEARARAMRATCLSVVRPCPTKAPRPCCG
jgi:NAD(P)-dependent dehydrogenase (short-subunit alcohol dehydrogenase family)